MAIKINRDHNNLLIASQYKTILKAKSIAQEVFSDYQDSVDDNGILSVSIVTDEDDDHDILIDEEQEVVDESVHYLVKSLMIDIEEQDLADLQEYDLLLEIKTDGAQVHQIGLFEAVPDEIDEDQEEFESDNSEFPEDLD